jgi:adenylate cyclase
VTTAAPPVVEQRLPAYTAAMSLPARHRLALVIFALTMAAAACFGQSSVSFPTAVNGFVRVSEEDLRRGIPLQGEWELYWGALVSPESFSGERGAGVPRSLIQVPGAWNNQGHAVEGAATYRLVVELPRAGMQPMGLYLTGIATAYRLFCNGTLVQENGRVSTSLDQVRGSIAPQSAFLIAEGRLEIVLQVANAEDVIGGLTEAPLLGYQSSIAPIGSRETLVDAIIFAAVLIMGLYHILLSIIHPAEKASLYFGILAVDLAIRGALTGTRIVHQVAAGLGFHTLIAAEFITVYVAAVAVYLYFAYLFPQEKPRFAQIPVIVVNAAMILFVTLVPIHLITTVHFYYELFLLAEGVLILVWLIRCLAARRDGALLMSVGFLLMLASAGHDVYVDIADKTGLFLTSYAMVVFVLLQSVLIARRYAASYFSARDHSRKAEAQAAAYGRFVPHEFLSLLHKDSIESVNLGDQIEMKLTVLFADIRSFTTLSEDMTPVENFNFLNSYLSRISPVVRRNGGFIDKYLGDGIMALFPGSPQDAVHAGLELMETVRIFNGHRANCGYRPIAIGVGINMGTLMLGTVGESSRMEGTVISDAVNLASRLEGLTRLFGAQILVSSDLLAACPDAARLPHRYLGRVRVKGKLRAVTVYEIIDAPYLVRMDTREIFEEALRNFERRSFKNAVAGFQTVMGLDPADEAARYYLKRLAIKT